MDSATAAEMDALAYELGRTADTFEETAGSNRRLQSWSDIFRRPQNPRINESEREHKDLVDIIAIHGLTSDATNTWGNGKEYLVRGYKSLEWPRARPLSMCDTASDYAEATVPAEDTRETCDCCAKSDKYKSLSSHLAQITNIMPSWAQGMLPNKTFIAITSQCRAHVNSSGWPAALRETKPDHGIEMTCLYKLLQFADLGNALRLLQWEDPVCEAIRHGDVKLLSKLRDAGASFDGDEQSLLEAVSNGRFSVAQFLIANGCAKWLLTASQKWQLIDSLSRKDERAIRRIIEQAFAIRRGQRAFTQDANDFRDRLQNSTDYRDRIQGLLRAMGQNSNIQSQAFHTMKEILNYRLPTTNKEVFPLLLAASSSMSVFPQPHLRENVLFLDELDRWRLQIDEGPERDLFDEVVRLAWGKERDNKDAPRLDINNVNAKLRDMITCMGRTLRVASKDSSLIDVQPTDQMQTSPTTTTVDYASPFGSSRRSTFMKAIVLLAVYVCAAVLSLMLVLQGSFSSKSILAQGMLSYPDIHDLIQAHYLEPLELPHLSKMIEDQVESEMFETLYGVESHLTSKIHPSQKTHFKSSLESCRQGFLAALWAAHTDKCCGLWGKYLTYLGIPYPTKTVSSVTQVPVYADFNMSPVPGGVDQVRVSPVRISDSQRYSSGSPPTTRTSSIEETVVDQRTSLVAEVQLDFGELEPIAQYVRGSPSAPGESAPPHAAAHNPLKRKRGPEIEIDRYGNPFQQPTPLGNDKWKCNNLLEHGGGYILCPKSAFGSRSAYLRHEKEKHRQKIAGVNSWECCKHGCPDYGKDFKRKDLLDKHCKKHVEG